MIKELRENQPEGVNSRVHVPGVVGAGIGVVVIQREKVNVMKDKAVDLAKLEGFHKAYVK